MLTRAQLLQVMPHAGKHADVFLGPLNDTATAYDIDTPLRMAAFLSQIAQESGELQYMEELASGKAYDTGPLAARLGNTPEADGDGQKMKGHGLIQCTGGDNHRDYAAYKGLSLDDAIAFMKTPAGAADVSGWFWQTHNCNDLIEPGDCKRVTRRVNGAATDGAPSHYLRRKVYFDAAKKALGA